MAHISMYNTYYAAFMSLNAEFEHIISLLVQLICNYITLLILNGYLYYNCAGPTFNCSPLVKSGRTMTLAAVKLV